MHFISGLPRSGSTLLAALLRQNPHFSAEMTSPMALLCGALMKKMSGGVEFGIFFDDIKRQKILRSIFSAYYADQQNSNVIFDTNRSWTGKTAVINHLFPTSKIICCVRDIGWIVDSVERMLVKNPLQLSSVFNFQPGQSVYSRAEILMNSEHGLIGQAWSTLREAWFGNQAPHLIVIKYENLAREPARVLKALYTALDEPFYAHDFDNVAYDAPEFDAEMGMPGMHKVRSKVELQERMPCIPPDLFAKYQEANFWLRPELNPHKVKIL